MHPFGIAMEHAAPIETFFLGIGMLFGPLFFAKHMVTLWAWLTVRLFETVEDHAGYDLPFNPTNLIPFWGGAVHHDFHHKTFAAVRVHLHLVRLGVRHGQGVQGAPKQAARREGGRVPGAVPRRAQRRGARAETRQGKSCVRRRIYF